jgi:hypothetical protein
MNPKPNMFDRIMMSVLALTSLVLLVAAYPAGFEGMPLGTLLAFAFVGFAYVLYQAIRLGSPLLTAATAAVIMVGYLAPAITHWRDANDYWRNNIWEPLGPRGFAAIGMTTLVVAIVTLPLWGGAFVAWIVQRVRRGRPAPPPLSGSHAKGPPPLSGTAGPPPMPPPLPSGTVQTANPHSSDSP